MPIDLTPEQMKQSILERKSTGHPPRKGYSLSLRAQLPMHRRPPISVSRSGENAVTRNVIKRLGGA